MHHAGSKERRGPASALSDRTARADPGIERKRRRNRATGGRAPRTEDSPMIDGLYTAASGLAAEQRKMDAVANDVANVDTPGYQSERVEFSDVLGGGVVARSGGESAEQGAIEETGQPFDLAIQGDGYFQVLRPNGQLALTRNGSFRPDSYGRLVTPGGDRLDPPVTVPTGIDPAGVSVAPNGRVSANGSPIGQVNVVTVPAPAALVPIGDGLVAPSTASGAVQPATGATIAQGAL